MPLCCDQDTPRTENDGNIGRKVLLMFTLSGFGGAASLAVAEAMIDSNSNGGAASASCVYRKPKPGRNGDGAAQDRV